MKEGDIYMKFLGWYSFVVILLLDLYLLVDLFSGNDPEGNVFGLAIYVPVTIYCFLSAKRK